MLNVRTMRPVWVWALGLSLLAGEALAGCAFKTREEVRLLSADFPAWHAVAEAMDRCARVSADLDQDFRTRQPAAFAANPAQVDLGGVSNATLVPLLEAGTLRPLDDLVGLYGFDLRASQLIRSEGRIVAVAMMINTQHLVYRSDIFAALELAVPTTYAELLAAAAAIDASGKVPHALGGTYRAGWDLGQEFVNLYLAHGGQIRPAPAPPLDDAPARATLALMQELAAHLPPGYLEADSAEVQRQLSAGDIAMAVLWASRVGALEDRGSAMAGQVGVAAAPAALPGGRPASTLWWDGLVVARNIPDARAETAFRVALEGLGPDMVRKHNDDAMWLVDGYRPGPLAAGAAATAAAGAPAYPASARMDALHTALGETLPGFLLGDMDADATLSAVAARLGAAE